MFSIFKRPAVAKREPTFKTRVGRFWEWYVQVAARFYQVIEDKKSPTLAAEVSGKVGALLPGFAWVFGPGANERGHSFTLSGEGDIHRQLLAMYWLSQAPEISGWTFYCSRQPGSIQGIRMDIGGKSFNPIEFWVTASSNGDTEKVDLAVWHPMFDSMPEKDRWTVLFLFLDEVLGEFGTQQWIGEIQLNDGKLADSMPLHELKSHMDKVGLETGWKKLPPGEAAVVYTMKPSHQRFLRGDIFTGATMHARLIEEYLNAEGELSDPLAGTGADYVFVAFDVAFLPNGNQAGTRGIIEDALAESLEVDSNGRCLGGAIGTENAYIDLLLFDGDNSLETVRQVLKQQGLPSGTSINFFAKEKRGRRIII